MGTRSRIVIKRKNKKSLKFWAHWDGFYCNLGSRLCNSLKNLLEKYSITQLLNKINYLDGRYKEYKEFDNTNLEDVILNGDMSYLNNCIDFEYEYIIDFDNKYIIGKWNKDVMIRLSFDEILDDLDFVKLVNYR